MQHVRGVGEGSGAGAVRPGRVGTVPPDELRIASSRTDERPRLEARQDGAVPALDRVMADLQVLLGEVMPIDDTRDGATLGRLADAMSCAHLITDELGVVVEVNDRGRAMLDSSSARGVAGRHLTDLVEPASRVVVKEMLADPSAIRGGPTTLTLETGRDSAREVEAVAAEIGHGLTRWLLRVPAAPDPTEPDPRRRLLANVPVAGYTCVADRLWTCAFVTAGLHDLLGFDRDTWTEDPRFWLARVHPLDRERLVVERLEVLAQRRRLSIDYRIRDAAGETVWVRDEARPEIRDGQIVALHGILSDATSRHRSEELLESLREASHHEVELLRARDARLSTVVRVLAHDVRNPLTGAMGWLDTALRDDVDIEPERQRDMLARSRADLTRLRRLLDDVVEGQRVWERGVMDVQDVEVDLIVDGIRETTDAPGHRIVVEGRVRAMADPFVIERAVANLVNNAVTHTPDGTTIRIQIVRAVEPEGVVIAVEDDGPGVGDQDKERIWEPFARGGTEAAGSGLGLSIVRDLAELHGGRAWVEDAPGGGASFRLFIAEDR